MSIMNYLVFRSHFQTFLQEKLLSFKLAYDVTDLPLLSAMLQKIQRFGER